MLRVLDNAGLPLSDRDEEARLRAAVAAAAGAPGGVSGPAPGAAHAPPASSSDEEDSSGEEGEEDTRTIAAVRPGALRHRLPPLPLSARLHARSKLALQPATAQEGKAAFEVAGAELPATPSPRQRTHPLLSLGLKVAVSVGMAALGAAVTLQGDGGGRQEERRAGRRNSSSEA